VGVNQKFFLTAVDDVLFGLNVSTPDLVGILTEWDQVLKRQHSIRSTTQKTPKKSIK
jgi:hypothetical protein